MTLISSIGSVMQMYPRKSVRRKAEYYSVTKMCVEGEQLSISFVLNGPEKVQWQFAMEEELKSFRENDTLELADKPNSGQN